MPIIVRARIIKIGHSQGVRIPKLLLDQTDLGEEVELELQQNQIVIRSAHQARANWEELFEAMAARGDDRLLEGEVMVTATWDRDEWEW